MTQRPPNMVTLRPGGRVVPRWYQSLTYQFFVAGIVLILVGVLNAKGTGEIALGVILMVASPLALYFGGPFGDRPYGR